MHYFHPFKSKYPFPFLCYNTYVNIPQCHFGVDLLKYGLGQHGRIGTRLVDPFLSLQSPWTIQYISKGGCHDTRRDNAGVTRLLEKVHEDLVEFMNYPNCTLVNLAWFTSSSYAGNWWLKAFLCERSNALFLSFERFICKNNGVLFENQLLQIGLKSEFRQNLGEQFIYLFLYFFA